MTEESKDRVYERLMEEASKPASDRRKVLQTRKGSEVPRRYHMDLDEAEKLRAKFTETGEFQNPYRSNGRYWAFIQALIDLGIDKSHPYVTVRDRMKELLSNHTTCRKMDGWTSFEKPLTKENASCSKDTRGRIIQNAQVLQRLSGQHPYGWKLAQLHACVDILDDGQGLHAFRLRTGFSAVEEVEPVNELKHKRRRRHKTTKSKKAKAEAQAQAQAQNTEQESPVSETEETQEIQAEQETQEEIQEEIQEIEGVQPELEEEIEQEVSLKKAAK